MLTAHVCVAAVAWKARKASVVLGDPTVVSRSPPPSSAVCSSVRKVTEAAAQLGRKGLTPLPQFLPKVGASGRGKAP